MYTSAVNPMRSSLRLPLIIACALFIENMDSTVIATSLPMIAQDLSVDPISLKLALTSYLVSLAVFIPISGWVADRIGARTTFVAAIAVFLLGSILCAISGSLEAFVASRFLQGMGGAMMVPVGRLVLLRSVPKSEIVQAWNYLTMPALLGPVIGPPLGGFITTYFHWRWIFLINIPIGLLGIWLALRFVPNLREEEKHLRPFDGRGFLLSGVGLSAAMLGLATLWEHMLSPIASAVCVAIGTIAIVGYWFHSKKIEHPLLDLRLFRIPTFRAGVLGGSLFRIGHGAVPFLLPLLLQLGFGLNPLESGLLTFVAAIGAIFMKTVSARILNRWGFRQVLVVNTVLVSASMAVYGLFTVNTPYVAIIAILLIGGCIRSLQFTSANAISFADVSQREMSQATSISSVAQQLSMSLGVTVGAYALQVAGLFHPGAGVLVEDFRLAFTVVSLIALSSFIYFWRLPHDAGAELAARKRSKVPAVRNVE
jgi:EmrB/QacA subfamily drug resistance transporter